MDLNNSDLNSNRFYHLLEEKKRDCQKRMDHANLSFERKMGERRKFEKCLSFIDAPSTINVFNKSIDPLANAFNKRPSIIENIQNSQRAARIVIPTNGYSSERSFGVEALMSGYLSKKKKMLGQERKMVCESSLKRQLSILESKQKSVKPKNKKENLQKHSPIGVKPNKKSEHLYFENFNDLGVLPLKPNTNLNMSILSKNSAPLFTSLISPKNQSFNDYYNNKQQYICVVPRKKIKRSEIKILGQDPIDDKKNEDGGELKKDRARKLSFLTVMRMAKYQSGNEKSISEFFAKSNIKYSAKDKIKMILKKLNIVNFTEIESMDLDDIYSRVKIIHDSSARNISKKNPNYWIELIYFLLSLRSLSLQNNFGYYISLMCLNASRHKKTRKTDEYFLIENIANRMREDLKKERTFLN